MHFREVLVFCIGLLLLSSCAQIGTLSGGEVDQKAPQPVPEKTYPANQSVNFDGKKITLSFDEFIQLNNPNQTCVVVPGHLHPKFSLRKKTVAISWDEDLKPNTTYAFYFNGTFQDVTEKNDSLMTFVFSTGNEIDSLEYKVQVVDALKNKGVQHIVVGLYSNRTDVKPVYYAKTDRNGFAQFKYLSPGKYEVLAFKDENLNMSYDENESLAFRSTAIDIDKKMVVDSVPLLFYSPVLTPKLNKATFDPFGDIIVSANRSLRDASFTLPGSIQVATENIDFIRDDSVQINLGKNHFEEPFELLVKSQYFNDTLMLRPFLGKHQPKVIISAKNNLIKPKQKIAFTVNSYISELNKANIKLINPVDSSVINDKIVSYTGKQIFIETNFAGPKLDVEFMEGAVTVKDSIKNKGFTFNILLGRPRDFGSIGVKVEQLSEHAVVQLFSGDELIQSRARTDNTMLTFTELVPGDYYFKVLLDENHNGLWDPGNLNEWKQPEKIQWYSNPIKVRANWDMEVELNP